MNSKNDPFVTLVDKCLQNMGYSFDEDQLIKIASLMQLETVMQKRRGKLAAMERLTPKQNEVLQVWCQGYTYKQTAQKLHRTENTIRSHVRQIYAKLGVTNKTSCIERAKQLGLIS